MSSWMAVRMKLGGGPASGVDMVSGPPARLDDPSVRLRAFMIPRLTKSLGGRAPVGQHGRKARRALRRAPSFDSSGGDTMRTKSRHRFSLAVLAALVVGVAQADAQSPEFAASFAK